MRADVSVMSRRTFVFQGGGQRWVRRDSGRRRDWPLPTRSAGCTEDAELGASGDRYPVRVRVENPTSDLFRVSESAVVVIRGP